MQHLERLDCDLPWSAERKEPQLPALLRVITYGNLTQDFRDAAREMGMEEFMGVAVGPNSFFAFPEGEPCPAWCLEYHLPGAKWHIFFEASEEMGEFPDPNNVIVFTFVQNEVN